MARRLRSVGSPSLDIRVESFATCGVTFSHPALGVAHPWRVVRRDRVAWGTRSESGSSVCTSRAATFSHSRVLQ
ncbi:MAG: hypothetical protein DHS20C11_09550 [Lysobacteraceae bacterium]|nr:MAG: hypothetical protein DHS20C11_09550 [Xanthomonadaceae bacterium]